MKYRKTALVEAEQFHFDTWAIDLSEPFRAALCFQPHAPVDAPDTEKHLGPHIHTLEGAHDVVDGAWIARGIKGEFWPIKDDIFQQTYEAVELPMTIPPTQTTALVEQARKAERLALRDGANVLAALWRDIASALTEQAKTIERLTEERDNWKEAAAFETRVANFAGQKCNEAEDRVADAEAENKRLRVRVADLERFDPTWAVPSARDQVLLLDERDALRSRLSDLERVLRDLAPVVRAAQDVVGAWRIGNVHEDHWLDRLDAAFRAVPDERRPAFHEALRRLLSGTEEGKAE